MMNNETIYYENDEKLKDYARVERLKKVIERNIYLGRYKHMKSITTPKGREVTPEGLFDFVIGDKISLKWCPSTLDLEQHEGMKEILNDPNFDRIAFRNELKRIYCSVPELTQKLMEETANHRNAFIAGDIDEPEITTIDVDRETVNSHDSSLEH